MKETENEIQFLPECMQPQKTAETPFGKKNYFMGVSNHRQRIVEE
jgi:hypothetical protein